MKLKLGVNWGIYVPTKVSCLANSIVSMSYIFSALGMMGFGGGLVKLFLLYEIRFPC